MHNRGRGAAAEGIVARAVEDLLRVGPGRAAVRAGRGAPERLARAPVSRALGRRRLVGDPVDVATGEVVLRQVDAALPGVLPLFLTRTHLSSYRLGGLFGPSWASTLDQRLEFGPAGPRFVGEDGLVLDLPSPGSGWQWLARADGTHTVTDLEHGRILHFPATPGTCPLVAITDRHGNRVDIERDTAGVPTAVRHSGGYLISVDSTGGLVTGLRLGSLRLASFSYDGDGRLGAVADGSGQPYRLAYDQAGRLVAWVDRAGHRCEYRYDAAGRCVAVSGPGGARSARLAYGPRRTEVTDALGGVTRFDLNARGQVVRETDPLGNTTVSRWGPGDRLVGRTDALGRTTRYAHDAAGNLVAVTRPDGVRAWAAYNELGLPVRVREPDGAVWRWSYDRRGNLVARADPAGAVTRYAWDERGRPVAVVDALGGRRTVTCDAAGLVVAVTDALGNRTELARDPLGRVTAVTDPAGGVTRLRWSAAGDLLWRRAADGAVERWAYDGDGNLTAYTDPVGGVTRVEYGPFGVPVATTAPDGARTTCAYDAELRLRTVTDPDGRSWSYTYDAAGNLTAERDVNGVTTTYTHDAAGQLVSRTTPVGTARYDHDVLGHLTAQHTADGTLTYGYDLVGRLVRATGPDADLLLERDPLGRVVAETCDGRTVTCGYDALGRRRTRRTPSGAEEHWRYDAEHRPSSLDTAGQVLRFGYDRAGREVARRVGEHLLETRTWTATHLLRGHTLGVLRSGRLLRRDSYAYRPDGHLIRANDRSYALDPVGRVTGVDSALAAERYVYGPAGSLAGGDPGVHNAAGQLVRRVDAAGTWTYRWDAFDRLTDLYTPTGDHWHYRYDPLGRRIGKRRAGGPETTFAWDGVLLAEESASGRRVTTWTYEPGTYRPLTQASGDDLYLVRTDPIGTPTALVTLLGVPAWDLTTTLWGGPLAAHGPVNCPLRFPGQYHDAESGLHYNHHRYYDPTTARYLTPDPLGRTLADPYAYVPNPTRWADPLGLTPDDLLDLYHGTSATGAAGIRGNGIDLTASRRSLDFGPGFYTTRDLPQATRWAGNARFGPDGVVLRFHIPRSELAGLRGLIFHSADRDWAAFVRQQRAHGPMHDYDYVEGPMVRRLRGLRDGGPLGPEGNQVSFHTEAATKILDRYLQ